MSTNISKKKRDDLLDKIKQIRAFIAAAPQDENTGNLLSYLSELEKDVNGKKYGLIFEKHREEIDEVLDTHTPVLAEEADLFIDHGGQMNFLLEGDNLAALKLLEKTHRGKIYLIYIDPPYNTGNKDFIYDDAFVDKNDCFTHSKWLSFMEKRLKIARRLLSGNGVIFISIDDREEAGLRLLCDEIFGENCFVSNISWQRNYSARNDSKGIVTEVEHLLVYSRSEEWSPKKLPRTAEMDAKYKNPDNDFAMWRTDNAYAPGASTHQGMVYAIQHPFTGEMLYPANGRCWTFGQDQMLEIMRGWCAYELRELDDAHKRAAVCGVKENEVRQGVQAIVLSDSLEVSKEKAEAVYKRGQWPRFFFTKGGKGGIARKTYLSNVGGKLPTNLWLYTEVGHTDEAKKEIMAVFDSKAPFSTPKPTRLIERILQIASNDDSLILDFFAGSGTTGNAVLKYNAEHEGSARRFILCTNNETIEDIKAKFDQCVDDGITKDAGEYVVSELARETMISKLDYLDIPLAELVGKKRSGNPGFDFHSQNKTTDTVIFGEAKYVTATTAYSSALPQIVDFIGDEKDVEDLPELKPFCTTSALQRAANGIKGFSAAFSAKTTSTDRIIANIKKRSDFQALLQYEELILVAVDL